MPLVVSSYIPFPNIAWWMSVFPADEICFDKAEHFEKMSYRNRYSISGANGPIQLSIPLVNGRNQRAAMNDVQICNKDRWQVQQWRTLVSVYRRAPYFDFYEPTLQPLFEAHFDKLIDFNLASIKWLMAQIKILPSITETDTFIKQYADGVTDLRGRKPAVEKNTLTGLPEYYQLFSERHGFTPNLSLLDLLFSEGPLGKLKIVK